ncbi:aminotransferase class I/II-fold pyridoxal phosphate-dependent enzyme [Candidatus Peregrinibacteria bacterium]|nr:aminotransferase class I/II-fold pyridoxal phosphate-dependent enzyme [Candidatus Peregrinibacteria bacterium]
MAEIPSRRPDKAALHHAERIGPALLDGLTGDTNATLQAVLHAAFGDPVISAKFQGSSIRRTAMAVKVVKLLLEKAGVDPEILHDMSIGDVAWPEFVQLAASTLLKASYIHHTRLYEEEGPGYDLDSQGTPEAREALVATFDYHYGFSAIADLPAKLSANMCLMPGGMRTLDDLAEALTGAACETPNPHRFIAPDSSFATWHEIVRRKAKGRSQVSTHKITTEQKDGLHLTADKVRELNAAHPIHGADTWYITPVSNPSGNVMTPEQLFETCEEILRGNPEAVIILDCAYIRTLVPDRAKLLMQPIIQDAHILNSIVFVESFSKTHGFCGERLGCFFSANEKLFAVLQNHHMVVSAGDGLYRSALALAISESTPQQVEIFNRMHALWAAEKKGLYNFLRQPKFAHLFDEDQSHIDEADLGEPMGLYLLLKLKPGVNAMQVAIATHCLGVETKLGSGMYVRFALGKITKPMYSDV